MVAAARTPVTMTELSVAGLLPTYFFLNLMPVYRADHWFSLVLQFHLPSLN